VIERALPLLAILTLAGTASAQARDDTARARALFEEASTAVAEGRLAEAQELFRESLALEPRAATAFNLAVALRESGAFAEALDTYEALLAGDYGELSREQRRDVRASIEETRASLGRVIVTVNGADDVLILVDGRTLQRVDDGARVEVVVDPGEHVVTARAADIRPIDEEVRVGRGESRNVELDLAPWATDETGHDETGDGGGLFSSPWPWIIFGAVVLAGAAVAIAVTVGSGEPEPQPLPDDLVLGRVSTLSF
jgi:hypothetical protein